LQFLSVNEIITPLFSTPEGTYTKGGELVSSNTTDKTKVALSNDLRSLVRESKEHKEFALPQGVEHAINDWRFCDVPNRLREECDIVTRRLYEEQVDSPSGEPIDERDFKEYVWLHKLLIEWKLLEEKFVSAGIQFAVAR
jgi:hypothetical protein